MTIRAPSTFGRGVAPLRSQIREVRSTPTQGSPCFRSRRRPARFARSDPRHIGAHRWMRHAPAATWSRRRPSSRGTYGYILRTPPHGSSVGRCIISRGRSIRRRVRTNGRSRGPAGSSGHERCSILGSCSRTPAAMSERAARIPTRWCSRRVLPMRILMPREFGNGSATAGARCDTFTRIDVCDGERFRVARERTLEPDALSDSVAYDRRATLRVAFLSCELCLLKTTRFSELASPTRSSSWDSMSRATNEQSVG